MHEREHPNWYLKFGPTFEESMVWKATWYLICIDNMDIVHGENIDVDTWQYDRYEMAYNVQLADSDTKNLRLIQIQIPRFQTSEKSITSLLPS